MASALCRLGSGIKKSSRPTWTYASGSARHLFLHGDTLVVVSVKGGGPGYAAGAVHEIASLELATGTPALRHSLSLTGVHLWDATLEGDRLLLCASEGDTNQLRTVAITDGGIVEQSVHALPGAAAPRTFAGDGRLFVCEGEDLVAYAVAGAPARSASYRLGWPGGASKPPRGLAVRGTRALLLGGDHEGMVLADLSGDGRVLQRTKGAARAPDKAIFVRDDLVVTFGPSEKLHGWAIADETLHARGSVAVGDRHRRVLVDQDVVLLHDGQNKADKGIVADVGGDAVRKLSAPKFPDPRGHAAIVLRGDEIIFAGYDGLAAYRL